MPTWFALALCGLGAAMVVGGLRQSARGRETWRWTRTQGRVLASEIERLDETDEHQRARFAFIIRYAYEARGREHASEQLWIGSSSASSSEDPGWARRWVERFPAGRDVPVWFDPADPRQAVLVQGIPGRQDTALLVVGGAIAAIGVVALARALGR